jgi:hypothetical protein
MNSIIEQDHRFVKKRVVVSQRFRSVDGALNTIAGYEAMHIIRKGQIRWLAKDDTARLGGLPRSSDEVDRRVPYCSKLPHIQTGYQSKVTNVMLCNGIFQLNRAAPDDQIREWHRYPFYRLLATNAGDDLRRNSGNRMNRDMLFQFVQKPAAVLRFRFRACVIDSVAQLGDSQSADHDRNIAGACRRFRITSCVVSFPRSAVTRTLESATKPLTNPSSGDSMVH